ncbi:MAG: DNA polymerase III subunit gamma/tau, partial [Candidatus Zixiibacteriota bacterium]
VGSGYLFCGPRGTGKTTVARILAKAINCETGPTETPCGKCSFCTEIAAGASLDVLEIDAASNTGVDDIRTLRENVRYLPAGGKKRIYIIDEIHRLSGSAFDALLKTLEEPPDHVMFVFATTEPLKVPETILSRTQRFDFRRVSVDDLAAHLRKIAEKEDLKIEDNALVLLSRKADGSVRDALSLMDQIAAFAGEKVTEEDVVSALGLVDHGFLFDFVEAIAEADKAKTLRLTKQLFDAGVDVKDFILELVDHLRTLLVLSSDDSCADLLSLPASELEEHRRQAENFSVGDLLSFMKILSDLNRDLSSGMDERLLLEVAAVKMATLESTVVFQEVLARMSGSKAGDKETANGPGQSEMFGPSGQKKNRKADREVTPEVRTVTSQVPLRTGPVNFAQIKARWNDFLAFFQQRNRMLASQLNMSEARSFADSVLTLAFAASGEPSMQLVSKENNKSAINGALREFYGTNLTVKFEVDENKADLASEGQPKSPPKVNAKKLVEGSPRLKKILKLVDGEVIGVRKLD